MNPRLAAALLAAALAAPALAQLAGPAPAAKRAVVADAAGGGPAWSDLSLAQQSALAPLKAHWHGIDANRKAKWIVVAQRFPTMPAEERQRVQARMAEWAAMSPAERGRARQNFQELRNLPAPDRQALWDAYRALPPEQQRELAQRAKPVAPVARPAEPAGQTAARRVVPVNPAPVPVKPVTPTVVQVKPGATTTLVSRPPSPPPHNQPGLPKIAATPGFVNPTTLLPRRGPQGAATIAAPVAPVAEARPARSAASAALAAPAASASTSP